MKFKLDFNLKPPPEKIKPNDIIFLTGSCFAESIGDKLQENKFNCLVNPNGIVFNPISIFKQLHIYANNEILDEEDLFFHNDLWHSWQHHGSFSNLNKEALMNEILTCNREAHEHIKHSDWLIITMGSAFVYELKEVKQIVSNCHKVPFTHFTKRLLTVHEITIAFDKIFADIKNTNPHIKIIFTVSPVRYIRDGLTENNLSKSILIQSVHEMVAKNKNVFYFPAYEIVIDELRDYRFYNPDMVHPNHLAIDYVWEKFTTNYMDNESQLFIEKMNQLLLNMQHKPLHKGTKEYMAFVETGLMQTKKIKQDYPQKDFNSELEHWNEM
jgi:hypothetical protein